MIIIGEKINATIPKIKEAIINHDKESLIEIAMDQEKAGAGIIDINVGTGEGTVEDEINDMIWLVNSIKENIKGRLCIDSDNPAVLKAGLNEGKDRVGLVNSVKATEKSISEIFPLIAEYKVPVIALTMDEEGIPNESGRRLKACEMIAKEAGRFGIPLENIYFDSLVMPVSTDTSQGMVTLKTLAGIKKHFTQSKTVLALSNVSFGLPNRSLINRAMLLMGMYISVDALLINPLDKELMAAIMAGEVVLGRDRHCRKYTRAFRQGRLENN